MNLQYQTNSKWHQSMTRFLIEIDILKSRKQIVFISYHFNLITSDKQKTRSQKWQNWAIWNIFKSGFSFAKNLVGGGLNLGSQISLEGMVPTPCKGA